MICDYCGKEAKGTKETKEHIISCSILDLFPECFLTIDNVRQRVYLADPMVKDVCANCNNNRISYIDSYAKELISNYFIRKYEKDDILDFDYNYTLVQKMLLKYAFNDLRSHKDDTSFFSSNILDFLINEYIVEPLRNVTVLAGLAINTSDKPDYMFGNNKIRWGKSPIFLSNSIIKHLDYETGEISYRTKNPPQKFKKMSFSYLFRFNSVQFLLICWDDDISDDDLKMNNVVLQVQYPYTILNSQGHNKLSRCTSQITYRFEKLVDVKWGQGILDEIIFMRGNCSDKSKKYLKEMEIRWQEQEKILAKRFHR